MYCMGVYSLNFHSFLQNLDLIHQRILKLRRSFVYNVRKAAKYLKNLGNNEDRKLKMRGSEIAEVNFEGRG